MYLIFDTETTGTDKMQADLVGISISIQPGKGYYIPVGHKEGRQLSIEQVLAALRRAARSFGSTVLLVTHNSAIARMADRVIHLHSGRIVEDHLQPEPADASELQW